ncbi:MAG: hypothetical protein KDD70_14340, partial [Bdellovibrionales bacterium]|nr:hypothetical protein [Bdellovibrionales bacterium]
VPQIHFTPTSEGLVHSTTEGYSPFASMLGGLQSDDPYRQGEALTELSIYVAATTTPFLTRWAKGKLARSGTLSGRALAECVECEALEASAVSKATRIKQGDFLWFGTDDNFVTLYREMSRQEYQAMVSTGRVQLSHSGMTHAATELGSYTGNPGLIVKFRTQAENVRRSSGKSWVQVRHPCDNLSKIEQKLNRPAPPQPHAIDIEIIGEVP